MDSIVIRGARQHNLKGIDLEIPRNRLVVITGVSGSGKSSLAFDTLFATNHRFYGLMDLFTDIPRDTDSRGLVDVMLKGELWASEDVRVGLQVHQLSLASGGEGGRNLGQEADAVLTFRFNDAFAIDWGGLIFVPGNAMKVLRNGEDPAFKTYFQSSVSF